MKIDGVKFGVRGLALCLMLLVASISASVFAVPCQSYASLDDSASPSSTAIWGNIGGKAIWGNIGGK
jgi:hypothetical protein